MSDKMIELLREFESAERAFAVAEWLGTDTEQHARRADEAEIAIFAYVAGLEERQLTPDLIERLEIVHEQLSDYGPRERAFAHDCAAWNNDPEDCDCKYREVNMQILELRRNLEARNG